MEKDSFQKWTGDFAWELGLRKRCVELTEYKNLGGSTSHWPDASCGSYRTKIGYNHTCSQKPEPVGRKTVQHSTMSFSYVPKRSLDTTMEFLFSTFASIYLPNCQKATPVLPWFVCTSRSMYPCSRLWPPQRVQLGFVGPRHSADIGSYDQVVDVEVSASHFPSTS